MSHDALMININYDLHLSLKFLILQYTYQRYTPVADSQPRYIDILSLISYVVVANVCPASSMTVTSLFIKIKMVVVIVIIVALTKNVANRDMGIIAMATFKRVPSAIVMSESAVTIFL